MTTLYFAYGSNMDQEQMHYRCPDATLIDTAVLPGYRFVINDRGVATIIPEEEAAVPGVVWQVSSSDESALDRYEGYRLGMYDKCFRSVTDEMGSPVLVYIDHIHTSLGASRDGYLDRIIHAAEVHGLPESHLNMLRLWPAKRSFRTFNRLVNDVKSGVGFPSSVNRHKEYLADALKNARDTLFLDILRHETELHEEEDEEEMLLDTPQQNTKAYSTEEFHKLLEDTVQAWLCNMACECERERAADISTEHTALIQFMRHVDSLQGTDMPMDELRPDGFASEVAGQGVIITNNPARAHAPENRFIVTKHAPMLGHLWRRLFFHDLGIHPRTCNFMGLFADIADSCKDNDEPSIVIEKTLAGVKQMAASRCSDIIEEFETDRLGVYVY